MPSRKRTRQTEATRDVKNSCSEGPTRRNESLARKLRKQMQSESCDESRNKKSVELEAEKGCEDTGVCDFSTRRHLPIVYSSHIFQRHSQSLNLAHYLFGISLGIVSPANKKSLLNPVLREMEDLTLFRTASPFDRRVTALEWHPTNPDLVVAGSKGGDIFLWNFACQNLNDHFIQGRGPGGNISAIKFHPFNSQAIFTSALDGRLTLHDLTGNSNQIFLNTFTWDDWYCCVDVSAARKVVVTGDNSGNTLLLSTEGKRLWTYRLHKQKVTHAEFSPREDWLLCTASTDQTVKMWDMRKVSGRGSALHVLQHDKPINSAYFSRTDGCRLLTTDQHSQIRVYRSPEWHLENTLYHPHRFFQHITPIKASWHPLQDLAVVGRYPDKDFAGYVEGELRTIDIMDVESGKMVCQLHDPAAPGIVSLNKFNDRGDKVLSGMGVNLLLWGRRQEVEKRRQSLMASIDLDPLGNGGRGSQNRSGSGRSRPPSSKQSKSKKDADTKMKLAVKTKTKTKSSK